MSYRSVNAIPVYFYANKYSSNKQLGDDDQVATPFSLALGIPFPPNLNARDVIVCRGAFNNAGNACNIKIVLTDDDGLSGILQTETITAHTSNSSSYPVFEARFNPAAAVVSEIAADDAVRLYLGPNDTVGNTTSNHLTVHGFSMYVEKLL